MTRENVINNSYLSGTNSIFIEELYYNYCQNPEAVDKSWHVLFAEWKSQNISPDCKRPIWKESKTQATSAPQHNEQLNSYKLQNLVRAYREFGYKSVQLDPLLLKLPVCYAPLQPNFHEILDQDFQSKAKLTKDGPVKTIKEWIDHIQAIYSKNVGFEFMHIEDDVQREWLIQKCEKEAPQEYSLSQKKSFLERLIKVEGFEQFLHKKFPGDKRFSVEGAENTILAVEAAIEKAAEGNVSEIIIGMAHRGRLNMLTNVLGKPFAALLSEFQGNSAFPSDLKIAGDVKYHMGYSSDRKTPSNQTIHLSLTPNPSHLEAVNPVVTGKVRARQDLMGDNERSKVMGLLIHGDAAFSGQGIIAECLSFSDLEGYQCGGIFHLIINNQVGFTANAKEGSSYKNVTDIAKAIQAPIFHVNGDKAEEVIRISHIASEFRQKFKKDVFINLVCYRKYGHNEGDEPAFTQPKMYSVIDQKKSPAEIYADYVVSLGVDKQEIEQKKQEFFAFLEGEYQASQTYKPTKADWKEGVWGTIINKKDINETGVALAVLQKIGKVISHKPENGSINYKIQRQLDVRKEALEKGEAIDWATAEALAYGTLLLENRKVRLSGQDAARGTFSHRHAIWVDPETENRYCALNHLSENQAKFEVINSNLSEYAVLGFEYGYSLASPDQMVIWEAQFGDFANGAQIIIDQFISSGETKWLKMSGLVLLLPHGHEGQGPEHTSARLERFLQQCAEDNMRVVNCTTPANFFHALRRQLKGDVRKPLIVMSPKSLLRHKNVVSPLSEMAENSTFNPFYKDTSSLDPKLVKKVLFCSGKLYYDLLEEREKASIKESILVRVEQIYPFPQESLLDYLKLYENVQEWIWCQEEPQNMGAWSFVQPYITIILQKLAFKNVHFRFCGRPSAASPSEGYSKFHKINQKAIVSEALSSVKN